MMQGAKLARAARGGCRRYHKQAGRVVAGKSKMEATHWQTRGSFFYFGFIHRIPGMPLTVPALFSARVCC